MTDTDVTTMAAWIRDSDLDLLRSRVARVNGRAAKLGAQPLEMRLTGNKRIVRRPRGGQPSVPGMNLIICEVEVEVIGEQPRLPGGWILLAVIDHREMRPIVKSVPGRELPAGQRERGPTCDRCGKVRRRIDTFVLRNDAGDVKQVGRNCLADFLGAAADAPERLLLIWASALGVLDGYDDEGEGGWGGRPVERLDVAEVVLLSAAVIDEAGWISKARSDAEYTSSTADTVSRMIWPPALDGRERVEFVEFRDRVNDRIDDALRAESAAAIAWARTHEHCGNDYLMNLAACVAGESLGTDKLALLVSLMAAYRREQDRLVEADRKAKLGAKSDHVGAVKERLSLTLTLIEKPRAFDGTYGTSYRAEFSDGDNLFVWWASSDPTRGGFEVGVPVAAKGTVKKHEVYRDVKRTVLTRVSPVSP